MSSQFHTAKSNPSCFISKFNGNISINEDRNLISFGKNVKGFLGHEEINEIIYPPKQIPNLNEIKIVSCGNNHIVCIDYEGNLFTFGDNYKGQLGVRKQHDELPFTHIPQHITNIPPIDFVSSGLNFVVCITYDGFAYSFGDNDYGQLGIGKNKIYSSPMLITDLKGIEFIQCGGSHVICKTYTDEYYSWGANHNGQLGRGNTESCSIPIKQINWPNDIIDAKCGCSHTLLLTSTGYVYSFGSNKLLHAPGDQLGLNDVNKDYINVPTLIKDIPLIKRIECGFNHSMCIDINNKLWVFGLNFHGQLGLGDRINRYKPTLNESLHDIIDISTGGFHTFIKTINNEIYAFGRNNYSQLGIKTPKPYQITPIQVFKDNEDIWATNITRSKQKSARK